MRAPMAKRNRFANTWDNLFTCNMGKLICYDVIPVLPGDYMRVVHEQITKAQALTSPAYGKLNVRLLDFFVPTRLLWDNWEQYWANGLDGVDQEHVFPYMETSIKEVVPPHYGDGTKDDPLMDPNNYDFGYNIGSSADYMGLPVARATRHSALWHRGVAKVINDWMINQDVEDEVALSTSDGLDTTTYRGLFTVNWRRDRFTNALPWQVKGDPVMLPATADLNASTTISSDGGFYMSPGDHNLKVTADSAGSNNSYVEFYNPEDTTGNLSYGGGLKARTTVAGTAAFSMIDFKTADQLNNLFMMNARTGNRYIEKLLANFGVRSSDARLQRSEYLGGSKSAVLVSEILQTSATNETSPQGNQSGHLYGVGRSGAWSKTFEEFGYVFCFYVISPKAVYSQGMPRELMKTDPLEFAVPMLSHLPETVAYNGELFWTGYDRDKAGMDHVGPWAYTVSDNIANKTGFGFVPQYDEYRHHYSRCSGNFRPYIYTLTHDENGDPLEEPIPVGGNMADWTFARSFSTVPTLSKSFIGVEDIRRPFATEGTNDHLFMVNVTTNMRVRRCLPKKGLPAGTF